MTKSNTLGVVGSIPIPEVIRNINSFTLGAQSVNPKVKTKVVWVNKWFDPPKETEAAQSLINGGADVLFQNTDSLGRAARPPPRTGKLAFGWDSDMTRLRARRPTWPARSSTGRRTTSRPRATRSTAAGPAAATPGGASRKARSTSSRSADKVPAETKEQVEKVKAGLKDGSFVIWKGPITGQDGKEVLKKDEAADDKFLERHQLLRQGRGRQGAGQVSPGSAAG